MVRGWPGGGAVSHHVAPPLYLLNVVFLGVCGARGCFSLSPVFQASLGAQQLLAVLLISGVGGSQEQPILLSW